MKKGIIIKIAACIAIIGVLVFAVGFFEDTYVPIKHINMETMKISFFDGRDYAIGEMLRDHGDIVHPEYEISLDSSQVAAMKEALGEAKKVDTTSGSAYRNCDSILAIIDRYKVTMGEDKVYYCDGEKYVWEKDPLQIYEAPTFATEVGKIAEEYKVANVYVSPFAQEVISVSHEGNNLELTSQVLEYLQQYTFSKVEITSAYEDLGQVSDVISFEDGTYLQLFSENGLYGYLGGEGYEYYVNIGCRYLDRMNEKIAVFYDNQSKGFGAAYNDAQVQVIYKGNAVVLEDEKAENVKKMSREAEYHEYDWLTPGYDMGDCVEIKMEEGSFYIPSNRGYGNRYYRGTTDNTIYFATNLDEKLILELMNLAGIQWNW